MRGRRGFAALLLVVLAALPGGAVAAVEQGAPPLRGFPLVRTVVPDAPEAGIQSFGVAAGPGGLLYVANLGGVLIHDGAHWRGIPVGAGESAFSVAVDAAGRVAVGGIDEIGYLRRDAAGVQRYVSLVDRLPPERRGFGQTLGLVPSPDGFLYVTADWIVEWAWGDGGAADGGELREVAALPGDRPYTFLWPAGGEIYGWGRDGLLRYHGGALVPVPGGEAFRGRRVDALLPADDRPPSAGGALLVSVRDEGLFVFRDGAAAPFAPEASAWARRNLVFSAHRLPDGRAVLGSLLGGILLLRPDGTVDGIIDRSAGLPDDLVYGMTVDREGGLWLALNTDLARVAVASPLTLFDQRSGLPGAAYHVARHRGHLWVAGAAGLFTTAGGEGAFRPVDGIPPAAWSLLSLGDDLLVGTAGGVLLAPERGAARPVPGADEGVAYVVAASPSDPDRAWAGLDDALVELRRRDGGGSGGGWRAERRLELPSAARYVVEVDGAVWCATELHGAVEVALGANAAQPLTLGGRRVADGGPVTLVAARGGVLALADGRLRRLDPRAGRLVDDPALAAAGGGVEAYAVAEDPAGNLWLNTDPVSVLLHAGDGAAPRLRVLHEVPARSVEAFFTESGGGGAAGGERPGEPTAEPVGTVWLASEDGLYRHAGDLTAPPPDLPAPLLARVADGDDRVLLAGSPGVAPPVLELPADAGRLRLAFGPLSPRSGVRYQTRLEPLDDGWGTPVADPHVELARLPPGRYTLRLRSVAPGAEGTSAETAWSFRVLPPWYRTGWAWTLWAGLGALALVGYGRLRSRALRQRAVELEVRVEEGTRELQRTVDALRRTQGELEAANRRLEELSRQDELTGVANRRRLQEVLDDEWSRARRQGRPLAFILLDLDHFKLLNDSRGHREGDRCLQRVARYLEEALPRAGDLLVRYGGEEFAVLLPDTGLEDAEAVAERLRRGLEDLALPHETAPLGFVTASLGVAATVPAPGERPGSLIEAADLALYRAKTEGRNRVRVDSPDDSGAFPELASN